MSLPTTACACCGLDRDPSAVVALQGHDDIKVCRECIAWLATQSGALDVTPILPVHDMPRAIAFYESAGFDVEPYDDGYAFVRFADASAFDLARAEHLDPARNEAACYLIGGDADGWHARLSAAGLPVTAVEDQPWGMRELTLTDPSGNRLRIGHPR
jgi:catechol 2,3-dioxygenase-like lactoylglutathione lyase family enzyme